METTWLAQTFIVVFAWLSGIGLSHAEELSAAVTGSFGDAIKSIATRFEAETSATVTLILGSTGKHYAQIKSVALLA